MLKVLKYLIIGYGILLGSIYFLAAIVPAPSADIREGFSSKFSK
jgi:hypothetical protein